VDSLLTALEYCVKQHGVAPNYSNVIKMLIALEDADRLQKGMHAFCPLKSCLTFCPCDAMLDGTSYGHVCLYVASWCSVKMSGQIELVLGMVASFDLSYTVL